MTSAHGTPSTFDSVIRDIDRTAAGLGITLGEDDALLRDIYGRVALYLATAPEADKREALADALAKLGPYVRQDRTVVVAGDPTADAVLGDGARVQWVCVEEGDSPRYVRIVERRLVGADWVVPPVVRSVDGPKRIVFASMKGGVGRSTALCAAAVHLARQGKRVLVVDLDLEAPGVGGMLAGRENLPEYGVIDWLAGMSVGAPPPGPFVARNVLRSAGGFVDVVPAYGRSSLANPVGYVAKLGRALAEVSTGDATPTHERVSRLIDEACSARDYDVVLIDARAGLSEVTAGAIVALGATVLLFGTAQQQSIDDYTFLFAHMLSLVEPGRGAIWKHLVPVLAKAAPGEHNARAQDAMFDLFERFFYEPQSAEVDDEAYHFGASDEDAPHRFVPIPFNPAFATFDPQSNPNDIDDSLRGVTFEKLLLAIEHILKEPNQEPEPT